MNAAQLKSKFPNASKSFIQANCDLGGLQNPQPQHRKVQTLARRAPKQTTGPGRVVICIISFRTKALDDDNLTGGAKALRDAIATSLGIDDADPRIEWKYTQTICQAVGTLVSIAPI